MTTALDPAARPPCVFGADGELRCGTENMWGPRTTDRDDERIGALVEAETQQAVQHRQWLWQQQKAVVSAQQQQQQHRGLS